MIGKLKGFFGSGSNSEDQAPIKADDDSTSADTPDMESAPSSSGDAPPSETAAPVAESKKAIQRENTIPLPVDIRFTTILPMTVEEKKKARSRYVRILFDGFIPLNFIRHVDYVP